MIDCGLEGGCGKEGQHRTDGQMGRKPRTMGEERAGGWEQLKPKASR